MIQPQCPVGFEAANARRAGVRNGQSKKGAVKRLVQTCAAPRILDREARFIDEYLSDPNRNGTRAAIRAGYSEKSAHVQASRLLRRDKVRAALAAADQEARLAVAEAMNRYAVSRERIVRELARSAFASMGDFIVVDTDGMPRLDLSKVDADQLGALHEVNVEQAMVGSGEDALPVRKVRFKLYDRNKALVDLAKLTGIYVEERKHDLPALTEAVEFLRSIAQRSALPIGLAHRGAVGPVIEAQSEPVTNNEEDPDP